MSNKVLNEADLKKIGSRIKLARKEKKLTQEQLADLLDVSSFYISKLENGKEKISLARLIELSSIFGKNMDFFFYDILPCDNTTYTLQDALTQKISMLSDEKLEVVNDLIDFILPPEQ